MLEIFDNHAHSFLRDYKNCGLVEFGKPFTESRDPAMLAQHLPHCISYQAMIRQLLSEARSESLEQYLEKRAERETGAHLSWLLKDAGISTMLVDDGYGTDCFNIEELASLCDVNFYRILRIENELAKVVLVSESIDEALRLLPQAIFGRSPAAAKVVAAAASAKAPTHHLGRVVVPEAGPGAPPVVALKTIMAYRGGLALEPVTLSQARVSYHPARKELKATGRLLSHTYHYLLAQVLELAAENNIPVQIHCGLGDDDALLADANPLKFQAVLRSERFSKLKAVFLHCYPFVREAAYLASLYSGVYFDLSLANSLASPVMADVYYEALSAAPVSKILAGTDGHSQPESYWYGAVSLRRALHEALVRLRKGGYLGNGQEELIERAVLRGNAQYLYQIS